MQLRDSGNRLANFEQFYELLDALRAKTGLHRLKDCNGRMNWPPRGIYFFLDERDRRTDSGDGLRLVRVGTHALTATSRTSLWNRLSQHKGIQRSGGGNHRGSIFRLLVGQALIGRDNLPCQTWGKGNNAPPEVRKAEQDIEAMVSDYIGSLPFLWLGIDDLPGSTSMRGFIERNAIALMSNFDRPALDAHSRYWLGNFSNRERVRVSGLWNQNHVDETFDPTFIERFRSLINQFKG